MSESLRHERGGHEYKESVGWEKGHRVWSILRSRNMVYVFSCQNFNWQTWPSPTHLAAIFVSSEVFQLRYTVTKVGHQLCEFPLSSFLRSGIVFAAPAVDTEEV